MNKIYFTVILSLAMVPGVFAQTNTEPSVFPISLQFFQAKKNIQINQNELQWLAPCATSEATFEIQYSADGRNFTTIHSITADKARCAQPFDYFDLQPRQLTSYYRVKMIAGANSFLHSFVISVIDKTNGFEINGMIPSVIQSAGSINISSAKNDLLQIVIYNASGNRVATLTKPVAGGSNVIPVDLSMLAKGQYILQAMNGEKEMKQVRFLKQ